MSVVSYNQLQDNQYFSNLTCGKDSDHRSEECQNGKEEIHSIAVEKTISQASMTLVNSINLDNEITKLKNNQHKFKQQTYQLSNMPDEIIKKVLLHAGCHERLISGKN